ncbi:MAG: ABC transporter substrate-binding protein [Proteobacteria bacterium]|nr:ABC transporter substrate-binding protein [Pseudomonadota bacterium]
MRKLVVLGASLLALGLGWDASAQSTIKIGVLMPLTGNAASAGNSSKIAVELGAEIVNNAHPELAPLPLAATAGLPGLGGAKIELVIADHQGNPSVGQSQTLRLITQEQVIAITGSYHSSVTLTTSATAERYGIPFVNGESVAANLTERGFKTFFRVTPLASDFAKNYMDFMADLGKAGHPVKTLALVFENTEYGTSVADTVRTYAKERGLNLVSDIAYSANTTDVSSQVLQLKDKKPDAVIFISYTSDAILYVKTMKALDYLPPVMIADNAGFSDHSFITSSASLAQGLMNRSAWSIGKPGSVTYKVNEMFKAKTGRDLDDPSGRAMQGFLVLAEALNRAGSTKPDAILKALSETNLGPDQVMMGYKGVKFDAKGQNTLAATYLIQMSGNKYVAVWPEKSAEKPIEWPYKGWK